MLGTPTGDGRIIENVRWNPEDFPLPLKWDRAEGDHTAAVVGQIDRVWIEDNKLMGEGIFHDDSEDPITRDLAARAIELHQGEPVLGISVELDDETVEVRMKKEIYEAMQAEYSTQGSGFSYNFNLSFDKTNSTFSQVDIDLDKLAADLEKIDHDLRRSLRSKLDPLLPSFIKRVEISGRKLEELTPSSLAASGINLDTLINLTFGEVLSWWEGKISEAYRAVGRLGVPVPDDNQIEAFKIKSVNELRYGLHDWLLDNVGRKDGLKPPGRVVRRAVEVAGGA